MAVGSPTAGAGDVRVAAHITGMKVRDQRVRIIVHHGELEETHVFDDDHAAGLWFDCEAHLDLFDPTLTVRWESGLAV